MKFRVSVMELIKTDEVAPWNPNEDRCDQKYLDEQVVKQVLEDWDGCCWDNHQTISLEEAVEVISDVFGINPEE